MGWDTHKYLAYAGVRLRPALDLLARVPLTAPRSVVDLGCGAGNVTRVLAERWPQSTILGIDASEAMLAKARADAGDLPGVSFEAADIATWRPREAVDLIYSNAVLHWLPDHATLMPRLLRLVRPGGVLAVQMPGNFDAPSHREVVRVARSPRWDALVGSLVREAPVASPEQYLSWLEPQCSALDVWESTYFQQLPARGDGEHQVVAFVSGAWLGPFLERLAGDDEARRDFVSDYRDAVERVYPRERDGSVLFPVRRVFFVATRR